MLSIDLCLFMQICKITSGWCSIELEAAAWPRDDRKSDDLKPIIRQLVSSAQVATLNDG